MTRGCPSCVVLIGMRGSGKTIVGRALAGLLRASFIDCDSRIEERHRISIREIFAEHGEPRFREWEREVLVGVLREAPGVIATGGGAVLRADNVRDMRAAGVVIYLHADAATLASRIGADPTGGSRRPSLTGLPPTEELEQILRIRDPLYRGAMHLIVETTGRPVRDVSLEIRRRIMSLPDR